MTREREKDLPAGKKGKAEYKAVTWADIGRFMQSKMVWGLKACARNIRRIGEEIERW